MVSGPGLEASQSSTLDFLQAESKTRKRKSWRIEQLGAAAKRGQDGCRSSQEPYLQPKHQLGLMKALVTPKGLLGSLGPAEDHADVSDSHPVLKDRAVVKVFAGGPSIQSAESNETSRQRVEVSEVGSRVGTARVGCITDLARAHRRPIVATLHHATGTGRRPATDTGHHHLLAEGSVNKLGDTAAGCACVVIARVWRGLLPCEGIGGIVGGG
ncbi:hypothetical protein FQN60_003248 [Etheostoma spectabile]|uniref:Uncharacterized protein n=1 Tax=Etheostoma spectabile TaxID=54343 RepID=A0A5J5CJ45_9PERO|nr:hypothetical protein FQN60_003248 [Etheostoma spectabile]